MSSNTMQHSSTRGHNGVCKVEMPPRSHKVVIKLGRVTSRVTYESLLGEQQLRASYRTMGPNSWWLMALISQYSEPATAIARFNPPLSRYPYGREIAPYISASGNNYFKVCHLLPHWIPVNFARDAAGHVGNSTEMDQLEQMFSDASAVVCFPTHKPLKELISDS